MPSSLFFPGFCTRVRWAGACVCGSKWVKDSHINNCLFMSTSPQAILSIANSIAFITESKTDCFSSAALSFDASLLTLESYLIWDCVLAILLRTWQLTSGATGLLAQWHFSFPYLAGKARSSLSVSLGGSCPVYKGGPYCDLLVIFDVLYNTEKKQPSASISMSQGWKHRLRMCLSVPLYVRWQTLL